MTPALLRDLIQEVEKMAERHADDKYECKKMGSRDGALDCLKHEKQARSLIRLARKVLAEMEKGES